jgi:hypothetical protein
MIFRKITEVAAELRKPQEGQYKTKPAVKGDPELERLIRIQRQTEGRRE